MSVTYTGHREHAAPHNTVLRIDDSGPAALDWRLDVRNHSPSGLEWGFGGSGPAQLSLALCIDALDGDVIRAQRIYQKVKWNVIAHFDREDWTLTRDDLRATIAKLEHEQEF